MIPQFKINYFYEPHQAHKDKLYSTYEEAITSYNQMASSCLYSYIRTNFRAEPELTQTEQDFAEYNHFCRVNKLKACLASSLAHFYNYFNSKDYKHGY